MERGDGLYSPESFWLSDSLTGTWFATVRVQAALSGPLEAQVRLTLVQLPSSSRRVTHSSK